MWTYFKYITDMKVMYNDADKFYRYTTGRFPTREDAYSLRLELIRKDILKKSLSKSVKMMRTVSEDSHTFSSSFFTSYPCFRKCFPKKDNQSRSWSWYFLLLWSEYERPPLCMNLCLKSILKTPTFPQNWEFVI